MIDTGRLGWPLPTLIRNLPYGDGHSVLVLPGFMAANGSTSILRAILKRQGYNVHGWSMGRNWGLRAGVADGMQRHLRELAQTSGRKVSLVGQSLGGVFARELAKQQPDDVRLVVTLGSPFAGHPRSTNAWRAYEWATGEKIDAVARQLDTRSPPPVPTTAIYSRADGVVAWRGAMEARARFRENIEVGSSHCGMAVHPGVIAAVTDRLALPEGEWKLFQAPAWSASFFPARQ